MSAAASRSSLLMAGFWRRVVPPVLGLGFLVLVWSLIASTGDNGIPTPGQTWTQAVEVFSDPFYQAGPNDQGVGWNVLMSLQRIGAQRGGILGTTEPVWAALIAFVLLGEIITPVQGLGGIIVLAGVIVAELASQRAHREGALTR